MGLVRSFFALVVTVSLAVDVYASIILSDGKPVFQIDTPRFEFAPDISESMGVARLVEMNASWCSNSCQGPPSGFSVKNQSMPVVFALRYTGSCFFCGFAQVAMWVQDVGGLGFLRGSVVVPGHESRVIHSFDDWGEAKRRQVQAAEISTSDYTLLFDTYFKINANMTIDFRYTSNPWTSLFCGPFWIAAQVITASINLLVFAFGCFRLRQFALVSKGFTRFRGALICIFLETLASLLRVIWSAIDPLWGHGIFGYQVGRFLLTVSFPVSWLGSVMLFLVWRDVTRMRVKRSSFSFISDWQSKLILGVAIIVFVLDISFSCIASWRGTLYQAELATYFAVLNLLIAVVFMYYGMRFVQTLSDLNNSKYIVRRGSTAGSSSISESSVVTVTDDDRESKPAIKTLRRHASRASERVGGFFKNSEVPARMTRKLLLASVFILMSTFLTFLAGQDQFAYHPTYRTILFVGVYTSLAALSWIKILAFMLPVKSKQPKGAFDATSNLHTINQNVSIRPVETETIV